MKRKHTAQLGSFSLQLVLCSAAVCSMINGTLLAFFQPEAPAKASHPAGAGLTFAERVAYQRAIEDVYWRHRIWPKERRDPKPSLDAVMSQAQLEKKVSDYLRKSQALEDYWQRPITAEQLQAEMDRVAKNTKQPDVLHEIFEALGNDPFVIAECLARPALADRLLTSWYAYDQRVHAIVKQRAEAELQEHTAVEQIKQLSGKYSAIEFVRNDSAYAKENHDVGHSVKLTNREWSETMQELEATFKCARSDPTALVQRGRFVSLDQANNASMDAYEAIPVGKLSSLQEDETSYYVTSVIEKNSDHVERAIVVWPKESFESWLSRAENRWPNTAAASGYYTLPVISGGACMEDSWTATGGSPDGRVGQTAVWTGSEMIVWGGARGSQILFNAGSRYNPSTDNWTLTSTSNAPTARAYHTAVWTGSEMIIWGGNDGNQSNSG